MKQPKGLGRGLDAIFGTDAVDAKLKPKWTGMHRTT